MSDLRDFTGKNRKFTGTSGIRVTQGTEAQRVNTTAALRFNTNSNLMEYYTGSEWKPIDAPPVITGVSPTNVNGTSTHTLAGPLDVNGQIRAIGDDIIAYASSDQNLKENIVGISGALDKVKAISGNTFTWKADNGYDYLDNNQDIGVIAQEVEALGLPGITTTRDSGFKAVNYDKLVPVLIQAIKELSAKVSALEGS